MNCNLNVEMKTRRNFITTSGIAALGTLTGIPSLVLSNTKTAAKQNYVSRRPPLQKRTFVSDAVEAAIIGAKKQISDPELAWMFENCYPNTLDTTIKHYSLEGKPDTFVITGDIDAMWLRDSTAQIWPYLPLTANDEKLSLLVEGVINRQTKCVLIDQYANAFNYDGSSSPEHSADLTEMKPGVFERKYELDSLCYVIRLAYRYWKVTGNTRPFDEDWAKAMKLIVQTLKEQQRKNGDGPYKFQRKSIWTRATAQGTGFGNPVKPTGLICSVFRPSDDSTIFPYLIPSNFFAVASLRQLSEMAKQILNDEPFSAVCGNLADEVNSALEKYAVAKHFKFGKVFAYEIDGYGSIVNMDDPNVPNLLSLPYFSGIDTKNEVYQNTRAMILSSYNPYYVEGKWLGMGSPHTGLNMIWPMSYIMQAITSTDKNEINQCIKILKETHAETGFMHESFNCNNPKEYTRSWFAWANTIFGELILKILKEHSL